MRFLSLIGAVMATGSLAILPEAHAEGVKLVVEGAADSQGQGWLFKDPSTGFCGVVTAAHVVSENNKVGRVMIYSASAKASGEASNVTILSPKPDYNFLEDGHGLDLAVMGVVGAIAERGCTTSTLGSSDVGPLIEKLTGSMQYDNSSSQGDGSGGELRELQVRLISAKNSSSYVSFNFQDQTNETKSGYSGAPIVELDRQARIGSQALPEAMVMSIDDKGGGLALRFDLIQQMVRKYLTGAAARDVNAHSDQRRNGPRQHEQGDSNPSRPSFSFIEASGYSYDPSCPPTSAVDSSTSCGWRVSPATGKRTVSIVVAPTSPIVQHVALTVLPADASYYIEIDSASERQSDIYAPISPRTVQGGNIDFRFLSAQAAKVRVSVSPINGAQFELKIISVE